MDKAHGVGPVNEAYDASSAGQVDIYSVPMDKAHGVGPVNEAYDASSAGQVDVYSVPMDKAHGVGPVNEAYDASSAGQVDIYSVPMDKAHGAGPVNVVDVYSAPAQEDEDVYIVAAGNGAAKNATNQAVDVYTDGSGAVVSGDETYVVPDATDSYLLVATGNSVPGPQTVDVYAVDGGATVVAGDETYVVPDAADSHVVVDGGSSVLETQFNESGAAEVYTNAEFVYPSEYICLCDAPQMQMHESDYADVYVKTAGFVDEDELADDLPTVEDSESGYGIGADGGPTKPAHHGTMWTQPSTTARPVTMFLQQEATLNTQQSITVEETGNDDAAGFSVPMVYSHEGYKNVDNDGPAASPAAEHSGGGISLGPAAQLNNMEVQITGSPEPIASQAVTVGTDDTDTAGFSVPMVYSHEGYKNVTDGGELAASSSTDDGPALPTKKKDMNPGTGLISLGPASVASMGQHGVETEM